MATVQEKKIQYRLKNIREQGFSLLIGDEASTVVQSVDKCPQNPYFDITLGINMIHPEKKNVLQVNVLVKIDIFPDSEKTSKLAELVVVYEFAVRDSFEKKGAQSINIPEELLRHMFQVAVSSTRGVLFARLKGSPLQNCVLPLINVEDYIKKIKEQNSEPTKLNSTE